GSDAGCKQLHCVSVPGLFDSAFSDRSTFADAAKSELEFRNSTPVAGKFSCGDKLRGSQGKPGAAAGGRQSAAANSRAGVDQPGCSTGIPAVRKSVAGWSDEQQCISSCRTL